MVGDGIRVDKRVRSQIKKGLSNMATALFFTEDTQLTAGELSGSEG